MGFASLGVGGDVVAGAPFVDGVGGFACCFGYFFDGGVVGELVGVGLGGVDVVCEFGGDVLEVVLQVLVPGELVELVVVLE